MKEISSQNNFKVLSIPEEQVISVLEEGEVPQPQNETIEDVKGPTKPYLSTLVEGHSSTYAEMEKKETYGQFWLIR